MNFLVSKYFPPKVVFPNFLFKFSLPGIGTSGDMLLEKILEEEASYAEEREIQSPITMDRDDKRLLLGNGHTGSVHVTHI